MSRLSTLALEVEHDDLAPEKRALVVAILAAVDALVDAKAEEEADLEEMGWFDDDRFDGSQRLVPDAIDRLVALAEPTLLNVPDTGGRL